MAEIPKVTNPMIEPRVPITDQPQPGDRCEICFYSRQQPMNDGKATYLACCCNAPAAVSTDTPDTTWAKWPRVDPNWWCADGCDSSGRGFSWAA